VSGKEGGMGGHRSATNARRVNPWLYMVQMSRNLHASELLGRKGVGGSTINDQVKETKCGLVR
jgi:hypothetical protein